jgi:AraC-like DNA-binding protein
MSETPATLPLQYIRLIGDQLERMGVDVTSWLAASGLPSSWLRDPRSTVEFPQFRQLVLHSVSMSREDAMGLLVGERLLANTHGLLGYAASSSGTLRQAIEVFERFTRLRAPFLEVSHAVRARQVRVRIDEAVPLGDIRRSVLEAVVLSVKNVLDSISLGACRVVRVSFPFPAPGYAALAREMFGCEVAYAQPWAGITLPADVLDVPLRMSDPQAFEDAAAFCQRELDKLRANESLSARVRRLLLEKQNGFPSLQVTARLCRLTPRTLHRRLVDEGTSYRALLEDVRHTLAVEHLRAGHFSIEEIAYTLGYTDLANFRRAFKRWAKVPPSVHRKLGAEGSTSGGR